MAIVEAITAVFGGGLTGLVGAGVQRYFDLKVLKVQAEADERKYAHERELRKLDNETMQLEWAARVRVAETEGNAKIEVAESEAFAESMFREPGRYSDTNFSPAQRWLMVLLDFCRGIVRPALTVYLCVVTTMLYTSIRVFMPSIPVEAAVQMLTHIQNEILYTTSTVVFWWFGTRRSKGK
jgi:hypothetical protein